MISVDTRLQITKQSQWHTSSLWRENTATLRFSVVVPNISESGKYLQRINPPPCSARCHWLVPWWQGIKQWIFLFFVFCFFSLQQLWEWTKALKLKLRVWLYWKWSYRSSTLWWQFTTDESFTLSHCFLAFI